MENNYTTSTRVCSTSVLAMEIVYLKSKPYKSLSMVGCNCIACCSTCKLVERAQAKPHKTGEFKQGDECNLGGDGAQLEPSDNSSRDLHSSRL